MPRLLFGCLALATIALAGFLDIASAEQTCPGALPWRLKCPQYCCVSEFDEPLEGQYCCQDCHSSFDSAIRNSFACTSSHYLHKSWAVILMACGIAFILLVCCTCCCCCCCAPCRRSRRQGGRAYTLVKPPQSSQHFDRGNERLPLLQPTSQPPQRPSAPPGGLTSSVQVFAPHYPQKMEGSSGPGPAIPPPSYQATSFETPPPVYRP